MDPLFLQLPLECLLIIIEHVARQPNPTPTLAALLRVNKHIASLTLPALYNNPYQPAFHEYERNAYAPYGSNDDTFLHLAKSGCPLTRTLLGPHPVTDYSVLISTAFETDLTTNNQKKHTKTTTTTTPQPSFAYLAQIRHLDMEPWAVLRKDLHLYNKVLCPLEEAYMSNPEYIQQQSSVFVSQHVMRSLDTPNKINPYYYQTLLFRAVVWTLSEPILEQLQTITIPLSDIQRYCTVVYRLYSLKRVRFVIDEDFIDSAEEQDLPGSHMEKTKQSILQFCRDHSQAFPGRLITTIVSNGRIWDNSMSIECREKTLMDLFQILPPLYRPRVLDMSNWRYFATHPQERDFKDVHLVDLDFPHEWYNDFMSQIPIVLQTCRALKNLRLSLMRGGVSFKWAVQEKKDSEDHAGTRTNGDNSGVGSSLSDCRPAYQQYGLIPLQDVEIRAMVCDITDEVDDIVVAFSNTLRRLSVKTTPFRTPVCFAKQWIKLPFLTHLDFDVRYGILEFDTELLKHCPRLVFLKLTYSVCQYECRDIVPFRPFQLYSLTDLILTGWHALRFHPDTLRSTRSLKNLELSTVSGEDKRVYIPSAEELNRSYGEQDDSALDDDSDPDTASNSDNTISQKKSRIIRPHWSWDWNLPCLKTLRLRSEFAFRFQFKMLEGCLALETLDLDIRAGGSDQSRVVTRADLFVCVGEDDGPSVQRRRIVSPSLRHLRLQGRWEISDTMLLELLPGTMPNLESLIETQWIGYTLEGLMKAAQMMYNIREIEVSAPRPSNQEKTSLQLLEYGDGEGSTTESLRMDCRMVKLSFPRSLWSASIDENDGVYFFRRGF
ncbi:hypothetical protein BGZ47_010937 [Haplosporangium gracile]|nr:hypothetical protein BGZ47_010937 [Haplosporangium gracile]